MFTGIVEGQGHVESIAPFGPGYRFVIDLGALSEGVTKGDSVALDGTCLTAVLVRRSRVEFDVVRETVERTAFSLLKVGDKMNVERSMPATGRFHGHIVAGHVDGTGRILEKRLEPSQTWITIEVPRSLADQMIPKGSIAVDGVSLTLTDVSPTSFAVAIIPHTLSVTTLGTKGVGSLVNVEVDCMGKWVRKILAGYLQRGPGRDGPPASPSPGVVLPPSEALGLTFDDLRRYGLG